jgi:hypothetical protein
MSSVLGGPFNGYSGKQTVTNYKDSEQTMSRRVLRSAWNTRYAYGIVNEGTVNEHKRVITPFRAVNNLGDFLSRTNYVCGGPNQVNKSRPGMRIGSIISACDATGVEGYSGNPKFVPDSSDYIRFKKQQAMNRNYNDYKNGGDESNGSYVALMRVTR